ncbi:glycoside hydrolase family 78 protein [bacterium]|nr:glycoside hydrolase family 78 protein [bacterium]
MRTWMVFAAAVLIVGLGCSGKKVTDMKVMKLRCEYLENPLGIDVVKPRLSWILESSQRGQIQKAYRIIVASSPDSLLKDIGDLWDTGKIVSDQSTQVEYGGVPLGSRMRCYWKVCAWDVKDVQTPFSEPALWTMGLLNENDWKGTWIGKKNPDRQSKTGDRPAGPPAPLFRTSFTVEKPVKQATVYATARGIFELSLNGARIGKDVFAPEFTDYAMHIQYRTYDVTAMVREGKNAVGAMLGDGWYSGYIAWRKDRGYFGLQNSLLVQLEIEYADGTTGIITTDDTWRCSDGPILDDDILNGENYDARKEIPGWDTADFDDSSWKPVITVEKPQAPLVAQPSQPVQVTETIKPVSMNEPVKGIYVYDLGQNIAGWAQLRVKGAAGTKVTLRFAERLNPDGTIYTTNLRSAKATDTYILKGGGDEVYEPRFTFHGFQYIEVTGYPGIPDMNAVTGCVVHSTTPPAGTFECSHPMINKLFRNAVWGQRGNFISIPTDCPQRDERMGWMGDAQIFCRTATFNMDVAAFFTKWLVDVDDAQSPEGAFADTSPRLRDNPNMEAAPAWGDAGVIVPWTIYRVYGDTRIIGKHYDAMARWMDFLLKANPDLIRKNRVNNNYGDWLSINADTPKDLLATAYWAYDAMLMSRMARAVGKDADAEKYLKLFNDIKSVFQQNYVSPDGHVKGETQTAYLLALYMDLLPEDIRPKSAQLLVDNISSRDWHLSTGFVGCSYLNPVLSMMGHNDVAYRLFLNDTFPSWGYSIKQGATTIWERWDGWTEEKGFQNPGMNSFNHYSFGSVGEWMYRFVAGIRLDPDVPGYKRFIIHPYPDGLDFANATYASIQGTIASGWRRDGSTFSLTVTVPVNTGATIYVPADKDTDVTESGKPADKAEGLKFLRYEDNCAVYSAGSGTYRFASTRSK